MANVASGLFLLLFGVTMLVSTAIPSWVIGLAACIAGLLVLIGSWKRPPG